MAEGLAIDVEDVDKSYFLDGREIVVIRGLRLRIEPGERVAVVGASGTGKSTLLHLLGLLDRPGRGRVCYDGRDLLRDGEDVIEDFRNRQVGFVFQFHHLLPDFTALENVTMPLLIGGEPLPTARARATELLARVGLADRTGHMPGELSGGEQQRVAIARAMVRRPRLLLADEPTGNLDPATGASIHALLEGLEGESGTTLVVATHNHTLASRLPRILRLGRTDTGVSVHEGLA